MTRQILLFSIVTLSPVPLLIACALWGGVWVLAAYLYLTFFAFVLDEVIRLAANPADTGSEFPAATALSAFLGLIHFPLLALGVWALAGKTGHVWWEQIGTLFAFGLFFGQVSNSNAHELIHRPQRFLSRLGKWVYISLLYGHQTSAHMHVHHRFVATPMDPNTARLGEGYYRFVLRAWPGSFRAGLKAENRLSEISGRPLWQHPYVLYTLGGAGFLIAAYWAAGLAGAVSLFLLASYATTQLLLSDYVQHYGLMRAPRGDGKWEPVTDRHSWNAPHWFSSLLILNAPRHSDHHAHPTKHYPSLTLPDPAEAPTLPRSLPAMGMIALSPRLWRKVMDPRAREWRSVPAE